MDEHEQEARRMVCYAEARDGDSELVQAIAGALRERAEKIQSLDDAWTGCDRERDAARKRVWVLREALEALQDHHCGGMCERDHEKVMALVNAALDPAM